MTAAERQTGPVRMRDVARELGVSVSTVSRALSQPHMVSADTIERVNAAISRLDYRLNLTARDLRTQFTNVILVVVPRLSPLFLEIFRGAEQAAAAQGYTALMAYTGGDGAREQQFLDEVLRQRADGIILVTSADPARLAERRGAFPPMVAALDGIDGIEAPAVWIDNVAGGAQATEHLIALGHRRIAYLAGTRGEVMTVHREQGFGEAIAAAGLDPADCPRVQGDCTLAAGDAAMTALLTRYPRPTALFAAGDEMAIGALQAIKREGLRIGQDMSVIGFGDLRMGALYDPPLTTIAVGKTDVGRMAVDRLLAVISGDDAGGDVLLPTNLLVRATTGPPA